MPENPVPENPVPEAHTSGTSPQLGRRRLLGRAAAAGLLAAPGVSLLSACVGGGDDDTPEQAEGQKSAGNPLGVKEDAELEVVIFNGGLGTKYATDVHIPLYKKKFPAAKVTFSQAEEISTVLQPRFASSSPPDMVNNAGSKLMDTGALVQAGQVADLTELFDAPAVDTPGAKVRDTLIRGTVEQGTFNGKPYVLNYAYTVFGLWYDSTLFQKNGWTAPATFAEFTALSDRIRAAGITPYAYAGANAAYYQYLVILTSAAKIGGPDVLKNIDNLRPDAWKSEPVRLAAEAWAAMGANYMNKAHLGQRHTEVQLQQNQGRIAFYPSGSWLENEQTKDTPPGFRYAVAALPSVTTADAVPSEGIFAAAGEIYFASAKGKNKRGATEYLRQMLSQEGARGFTRLTKVMTVVKGAADGIDISPGLTSANQLVKAAGGNTFAYRWPDWYKKMDDECRSATNELMFSGGTAEKFCERMQKVADAVRNDPSVQKFSR